MPQSIKHLFYFIAFDGFRYLTEVVFNKFFNRIILAKIYISSCTRYFIFFYRIYVFRYAFICNLAELRN
ncbi:hypothetical protein C2855_19640 [Aeromonas bestiarum]|nr:hypothetical protein C2855_19640 [Aeromonas bestiarum]